MSLTNLDAVPFKVGDRVTRTSGEYAGIVARVVAVSGDRVTVAPVVTDGPIGSYVSSDLSFVDVTDMDADAKTDIRVVVSFHRPETRDLNLRFTDAGEADTWITYLKSAPGRPTVTVTRTTTETFTRNND